VVRGPGSTDPALRRRGVIGVEPPATLAAGFPGTFGARLEAERVLEQVAARVRVCGVGADAVESLQGQLRRDLRMARDERSVGSVDHGELVPEPFGVLERQAPCPARDGGRFGGQALLPEIERVV
jgi:hypothetical protein